MQCLDHIQNTKLMITCWIMPDNNIYFSYIQPTTTCTTFVSSDGSIVGSIVGSTVGLNVGQRPHLLMDRLLELLFLPNDLLPTQISFDISSKLNKLVDTNVPYDDSNRYILQPLHTMLDHIHNVQLMMI